ncbi:MAG: hypothetical protein ACE5JG_03075 [Planctomycetota bacterium]
MTAQHPDLPALLDLAAGREGPARAHLASCTRGGELGGGLRRLVAAGRRAAAAPRLSGRARRRALRVFREQVRPAPSLLRLVVDSWLRAAPALRAGARAPARYLRFEGEVQVEIQVTAGARGRDLRGQLTPPDFAPEVVAVAGRTRRRAPVAGDGTFLLRGVPRRTVELQIGRASIRDLEL